MRNLLLIIIFAFASCSTDSKEENALCDCLEIEEGQKFESLMKKTAVNQSTQKCVTSKLRSIFKKIKRAQDPKTALKESMKNLLDTECADVIFQEISLEEILNSDLNSMDFLK